MYSTVRRKTLTHLLIAALSLTPTGPARGAPSVDASSLQTPAKGPVLADLLSPRADAEVREAVRRLLQSPLDAEAAVRIALLNNRSLRATLYGLDVAKGLLIQARALPNPVLEGELLPGPTSELELRLELDLTRLLLAPLRSRVASAELDAARFQVAAQVLQTAYEVRIAFYVYQAAEQRKTIGEQALEALAAGRDMTRAMFEAGNIPELELAQQEAAYEQAEANAAQLGLEVAEQRERLNRLLGLSGEDLGWTSRGPLPPVPEASKVWEIPAERVLEASLELAALKGRLDATARRQGLIQAEGWLPDVSVGVFGITELAEERGAEAVPWQVGGSLTVTLPLLNSQRGERMVNRATLQALREQYEGLVIDLQSEVRQSQQRLEAARVKALRYQQVIVPAQQRVAQQLLLHYNAMQLGIFQLLQGQREQLEVALTAVDATREYWEAHAAHEALLSGQRVNASGGTNSSGTPSSNTNSSSTNSAGGH